METTNTARRESYLVDVLDVYGPKAVRLVAERVAADHAEGVATYRTIDSAVGYARNVVAGYVIDRERACLADCPDLWDGVTTEQAHEIRASVISDVAAALVDIANAAADDEYEARMSCRRRTNDCGCRTCG